MAQVAPAPAAITGAVQGCCCWQRRRPFIDQHPTVLRIDERPREHRACGFQCRQRRPRASAVARSIEQGTRPGERKNARVAVEKLQVLRAAFCRARKPAVPAASAIPCMQDSEVKRIEDHDHPSGCAVDKVHGGYAVGGLRDRRDSAAAERWQGRMEEVQPSSSR